MHLVVAHLSARYSGRGQTYLPPHDRVLIVKADGAIAIHSDKGHKPLNYMMATAERTVTEVNGEPVWTFDSRTESLSVYLHKVYDEIDLNFGGPDPGLVRDGTEEKLQGWLAGQLHRFVPELSVTAREYQTGDGPVDLLARKEDGTYVAVEIKRVAPINTVGQVLRYMDGLSHLHPGAPVEGMIAAVEFKQKTLELARKKGIHCLQLPEEWNSTPILSAPEGRVMSAAGTLFSLVEGK